ncbi:MAG: cache domain-containing protein [bacterium]
MSLFFILNNLNFAIQIFGSFVFAVVAWIVFDSLTAKKRFLEISKGVGFAILALSQMVIALGFGNENYQYWGHLSQILGLVLIFWNAILEKPVNKSILNAAVVVPALSTAGYYFSFWEVVLFSGITILYYDHYKQGNIKNILIAFFSFSFLTLNSILSFFYQEGVFDITWLLGHTFQFIGFVFLAVWIWKFLYPRINEKFLITIVSFFLSVSVIITLVASMVITNRLEQEAIMDLSANIRLFDYLNIHLKDEALAKSRILASNVDLRSFLFNKNYSDLEVFSSNFLKKENLGFLTIADGDGKVLLRSGVNTGKGDSIISENSVLKAKEGYSVVSLESTDAERYSIRSVSPIISSDGLILGYVAVGFPLDASFADNIKKITGHEVVVYEKDSVIASTVSGIGDLNTIVGTQLSDDLVYNEVFVNGNSISLRTEIAGKPFETSYLPLQNFENKNTGMFSLSMSQREIYISAIPSIELVLILVSLIMLLVAYNVRYLFKRMAKIS